MAKEHEKLQRECFLWFWNKYPEHRYLMHGNINSHHKWNKIDVSVLKGIGLVKGVLDLEFYYKGVLYVMDIKVGSDKLKWEQLEYIKQIEAHGGKGFEIRSVEQFKKIIKKII